MGNAFSRAVWVQTLFIPEPTLTEKNLPDQAGKVHIVTGGYAGVGEELVQILYGKNATVYVAGRSQSKADAAIQRIKSKHPSTKGKLVFLPLDLADLSTIKQSADQFLANETRLDVLVNNAGVMIPPAGSVTKQGHELQMGTNCLGHHLFTKFLHPILKTTAASSPAGTVRIVWLSSTAPHVFAPTGGIQWDGSGKPAILDQRSNYGQSKHGDTLLAIQTQKILGPDGIISVSANPGNLKTELQRHSLMARSIGFMLYRPIFGAYTELWAGWSQNITGDMYFIMPWGRDGTYLVRPDLKRGIEKDGMVEKFWQYCEEETRGFA